ncbi:MAG: glycoside hydrolase family 65 protein [Candidatus Aminicenantes bacterium]|nr:glycoside hydrolase family 65 protein [Candidatus Aminicenantes bacterium]
MHVWMFAYGHYNPEEESLREALCTLGNGYFATRGAGSETVDDGIHYPGTYLAGGYNRLATKIKGRIIENEDLVNIPNWLPLNFRIENEEWFDLAKVNILDFRQEIHMREGVLRRRIHFEDKKGRTSILTNVRFVHMENPHLAGQRFTLVPENWSGTVEIISALDGRVINNGVKRYRKLRRRHLEPLETGYEKTAIHLKVRTNQSRIEIAQSARIDVFLEGVTPSLERYSVEKKGYVARYFKMALEKGQKLRVDKIVSLYTSRDRAISDCGLEARKSIQRAPGFSVLLKSHILCWKNLWKRFDIEMEIEDDHHHIQQNIIVDLYAFHILQTTSFHTMHQDTGVPARGWHGEAYRGHIFWDELFIFPFYNLRVPEITRSLLMYRYRRLEEARAAAKEENLKGALFPWQSGSNGREESQRIHLNPKSGRWIPDNSRLQRHVNAAIVYNIWKYYQVTRDLEFLAFYGAEVILEVARMWSSLAEYNPKRKRYEMRKVMGPDEYHDAYPESSQPGLNNNAYTNILAVWVLNKALELFDILDENRMEELCESICLSSDELNRWDDIRKKMYVPIQKNGIISQFEGYEKLKEFDWEGYEKKYGDIQRLDRILEAEGDSPNIYQVSKQADVLMLFYLFSAEELEDIFRQLKYEFDREIIPKNISYYIKRTSHGSTLSRVVHSWVLARSERTRSWDLFNEALKSDVADIQGGTTPEGIHLGAMAGTLDILQRCYPGIETREDMLLFNPYLPDNIKKENFFIRYRGQSLYIEISHNKLRIESLRTKAVPIKLGCGEKICLLKSGEIKEFKI